MARKKIGLTSLAQYRHVKFLITTEKQAVIAYRLVMMKLTADLRKLMKKKKLAKSEDLEKGQAGDWQKEGYTFRHELTDGKNPANGIHIHAHSPSGEKVGGYRFWPTEDGKYMQVEFAGTSRAHQRKGLASAAYQLAEKMTGKKLLNDDSHGSQTTDAQALWSQPKRPFGTLTKSEDPSDESLEAGWTGDIPQIEVDIEALTARVIDKYMSGLRWVLMGDFAGADAKKAAEAIGLKGKVTPGIVHAAYLQSLDSHAQHYKDVTGQDAPEMPTDLVKASFDQIVKRVGRFVDQTLAQLKLDVIGAVDRKIADHNFKALNTAHSEAHDALPAVGPTEAVAEAGESISDVLSAKALEAELKRTADNFEKKWDLAVRTDLAMASAAGTHQALLEIHGSDNPDVKVAWIEMEDERVCSFCHHASKNADGSHKLYSMKDFQPSGYNYSRKRAEWKLAIPPAHPRCRCNLVYIPPGFKVDADGSLSKK